MQLLRIKIGLKVSIGINQMVPVCISTCLTGPIDWLIN